MNQELEPGPKPAQQVSTINEQILEDEALIESLEKRNEILQDEIRDNKREMRNATRRLERNKNRRTIWLETAHKLQVLG